MSSRSVFLCLLITCGAQLSIPWTVAAETPADIRLAKYFAEATERLHSPDDIQTPEQWKKVRGEKRQQLLEMLGLSPFPERTPLHAENTGTTKHDGFIVERIHFQSSPGLYVTGNLYRPNDSSGEEQKPLPAILYVCGHGGVKIDGVSYGNKTHYQHHGEWFARNGYVCLTIDTIQLGELEGIHHGTYSKNRWWWLNRGYTPAGVEAWNCIRALDYLQSREEVDGERIGVTGRSGGGAYSWWIAAIDDRIKVAVPVAGITDNENHVLDGCVEGHCDCMYMVNTYQWDYPMVAALVAPRPLLISNTDDDRIFPLEGVVRTHREVRRIYRMLGAEKNLALQITGGPHHDTQELRVHAFRWFNHHLKGDDDLIRAPAEKLLDPKDLKVFAELPKDELTTTIDETFVPMAADVAPPASPEQWSQQADKIRKTLLDKSFRGWPVPSVASQPKHREVVAAKQHDGLQITQTTFESQAHVELPLWIVHRAGIQPELTVLNVLDHSQWNTMQQTLQILFPNETLESPNGTDAADNKDLSSDAVSLKKLLVSQPWAMAYMAPRGMGHDQWTGNARKQNQIRRRFYLLGQSLDGMRVWDVRQATSALRTGSVGKAPIWLQAEGPMAGVALHAAVFEDYGRVDLHHPPTSYRDGPTLLNVSRFMTLPQVAATAADRSPLVLYTSDAKRWSYVSDTAKNLEWGKRQFQIRPTVEP